MRQSMELYWKGKKNSGFCTTNSWGVKLRCFTVVWWFYGISNRIKMGKLPPRPSQHIAIQRTPKDIGSWETTGG
jgi:hypothetical protein